MQTVASVDVFLHSLTIELQLDKVSLNDICYIFAIQKMPIHQHIGTYFQKGVLQNEEEELIHFKQELIVKGKPEKGDGVVYDLCQG